MPATDISMNARAPGGGRRGGGGRTPCAFLRIALLASLPAGGAVAQTPPPWDRFVATGIATATGHCDLVKGFCGNVRLDLLESLVVTPNDQKIEIRTFAAPGLQMSVALRPPGQPVNAEVVELTVTSNAWAMPRGIRIGTSRQDVRRLLGRPEGQTFQTPCVEFVDGSENSARVCFEADRVASVRWVPWRD